MTLDSKEQLEKDLLQAAKKRDQVRLTVLRLLKNALRNYEIEVGHDVSTSEILKILQSEAKKRQDSINQYEKAGREDLVAEEKSELEVLDEYLPAKLSDEELDAVVKKAILDTNASTITDMGKVIKEVMGQTQGAADGARVSAKVKQALSI